MEHEPGAILKEGRRLGSDFVYRTHCLALWYDTQE